ncbi:MAG TPA: cupin domain-containing protein [Spirochaetes bacterium]|nr:cupin domain-containing protein [Spirochaetota bacterium]
MKKKENESVAELMEHHRNRSGPRRKAAGDDAVYTIVRKKDVKIIYTPGPANSPGCDNHEQAQSREKIPMRTFIITLKGKGSRRTFAAHQGDEFILVRKGSIKIVFKEREETLAEGDSIYYPGGVPHRIENLDTDRSVIVAAFCGP